MTRIPTIRARKILTSAAAAAAMFVCLSFASPAAAAPSGDRMLAHLTRHLNLTDAQSQQVKQVLDAHQTEIAAQMQAVKSARETLRQATLASPPDETAIRNAATALGQAAGNAAVLRAQVHAQIVPLLTSDQQQKFATMSGPGGRRGWKAHTTTPPNQ